LVTGTETAGRQQTELQVAKWLVTGTETAGRQHTELQVAKFRIFTKISYSCTNKFSELDDDITLLPINGKIEPKKTVLLVVS
jgi:hypothetical protein